MNKITWAICLIIVVAFGLNVMKDSVCSINQIAFALMNKTNNSDVLSSEKNSLCMSRNCTFSAVGTISSLNFYSNSISDIATSKKVVLSGDWILNVNNGTVSFFEADFVAAPAEGSVSHIHELVNLVVKDVKPIQLTSNGSTSILGTVDVNLNGINYWNDVKTSILVSKGNTITIFLNDIDTEHHFMKQPIYGIVDRLMY